MTRGSAEKVARDRRARCDAIRGARADNQRATPAVPDDKLIARIDAVIKAGVGLDDVRRRFTRQARASWVVARWHALRDGKPRC